MRPADRGGRGVVQAQVVGAGRRSRSSRGSARSRPRAPSPGRARRSPYRSRRCATNASTRSAHLSRSFGGFGEPGRGDLVPRLVAQRPRGEPELQHRPQAGAQHGVEDLVEGVEVVDRQPVGVLAVDVEVVAEGAVRADPADAELGVHAGPAPPPTPAPIGRPPVSSSHSRWLRCSLPMQARHGRGSGPRRSADVDAGDHGSARRRTGRGAAARSGPAGPGRPGRRRPSARWRRRTSRRPRAGCRRTAGRAPPAGRRRRGRAAPGRRGRAVVDDVAHRVGDLRPGQRDLADPGDGRDHRGAPTRSSTADGWGSETVDGRPRHRRARARPARR